MQQLLSRFNLQLLSIFLKITDTAKNNKSKRRKAKAATNSPLQRELDNCVSAIDKVLPPTAKVEGRRKKNPRPRRNNNGAGTRNHSLSKGNYICTNQYL